MNRKTNIFYSVGNDSKFLTFDNYSEALTGDILATDQKLWPSRFLCLYIKALDGDTTEDRNVKKTEFINKYLVPYYENKMAFLRDYAESPENDFNVENILPLNSLIGLLYYYVGKKAGKSYSNISEALEDIYNGTYIDNEFLTEDNIKFCYISDIIEQDYNGTYADIICTISTQAKYKPVINLKTLEESTNFNTYYNLAKYNNSINDLYGWENETNENIRTITHNKILVDMANGGNQYYCTNSLIDNISIEKFEDNNLKFNVIIPLFDSQYINKIQEHDSLQIDNRTNVPLGIYFTDKPVELEANNGIFNTNWSLLISMQFKAFPYSFDITHNFDDSDAVKDAYVTFAEILSKQSKSIDLINNYQTQILKLQQKISRLESTISSMSTVSNVDSINLKINEIRQEFMDKISDMNDTIETLGETIENNKLKWKIKNNE